MRFTDAKERIFSEIQPHPSAVLGAEPVVSASLHSEPASLDRLAQTPAFVSLCFGFAKIEEKIYSHPPPQIP